jgi:regulatory protein spx
MMIRLYINTASGSCVKAKEWLSARGLEFEALDLRRTKIPEKEFHHLLSLTENGLEDVLSPRSVAYNNLIQQMDIGALSMHELLMYIHKDQTILRRPLIFDEKRLQVGYNEEEIRRFLPRDIRKVKLDEMMRAI